MALQRAPGHRGGDSLPNSLFQQERGPFSPLEREEGKVREKGERRETNKTFRPNKVGKLTSHFT
jgi:hypothetical protein